MTSDHIRRLIEKNEKRGESTKFKVLNVIKRVGGPISPQHIYDFLYTDRYSELNKQYQEGRISKAELNRKLKSDTITLRTIHRKLDELTKEGLVDREGVGKYSLSINAKADVRYFAHEFGERALACFMMNFFPDDKNIRQSVSNLIKIFGTYVLYCFFQGSRPVSEDSAGHDLISRYLDYVFPIDTMYRYFLAIMEYLFDKDDRKDEKYISLSQEISKLVPGTEDISALISSNGDGHPLSAVQLVRAFYAMMIKDLLNRTKDHGYYKNKPSVKSKRSFDQLDQLASHSLDNELMKLIDPRTYDLLKTS